MFDNSIDEEEEKVVWSLLDQTRDTTSLNISDIFLTLLKQGMTPSWKTFARLSRLGSLGGSIPTEAMVEFIIALVGDNPKPRMFDPWSGAGVLLSAVATKTKA